MSGLQVIFAIFLGLILSAFVGVGVYTFYPSPDLRFQSQIRELQRRQQAIAPSYPGPPTSLTDADRTQLRQISEEIARAQEAQTVERDRWGRTTSIILVAFATVVMAISLVPANQLPIINSGLLLGGVFTMMYGVGWIFMSTASYARFGVVTAALVITLVLGYVRFVGRHRATPDAAMGVADLEQRVTALEQRLDEGARALRRP